MASILGRVFNGLLNQKRLLFKQAINNIHKYGVEPLITTEQLRTCNIPEEYLRTVDPLLNADKVSKDLCFRVRNDMINKHSIPEDIADSNIVNICMLYNKYNILTDYIGCVESIENPINIFVLSKFLNIYKRIDPKSIDEQNLIIHICDRTIKEFDYLPDLILQYCIIALSKTSKWQEALKLIEKNNFTNEKCSHINQYIITAAYKNNYASKAESILYNKNNLKFMHSNKNMYSSFLDYYLKEPKKFFKAMNKIFTFWGNNYIIPTQEIANLFVDACNKTGLKTDHVIIDRSGKCNNCNNQLSYKPLLSTEFNKLVENIIPKMIVGGDIFRNTTPIELKTFKSFVYNKGPFDIVIDSLNISSASRYISRLKRVLQYSATNYKNVLVVARQHMVYMTKLVSKFDNVQVFYLKDNTKDDPFMVYAALKSGINTKLITTDQLRQHNHNLCDTNLQNIFRRWQYTHQYYYTPNSNHLIEPLRYDPYVQKNNGHWHVPYSEDTSSSTLLYSPVKDWLCIDFSNIKHLK